MSRIARWCFEKLYRYYAVTKNVRVGIGVHIGPGTRLWGSSELTVGDRVYFGKRCTIEADGRIGSGCLIANDVGIVGSRDHDMRQVGRYIREARWLGDPGAFDLRTKIDIGEDVWIGYGAVVLAPVIIGRGAVVGAGAVVVDDVSPYSIVVGNPARHVAFRFDEDEIRNHESQLHDDSF